MPELASWAAARAWLIENPRNHFAQDPRYALRDPALIDPLLQSVLDRRFSGVMPPDPSAAVRVAQAVLGSYKALRNSDAGRASIEAALVRHYEHPDVRHDASGTYVDLGVAPGRLERVRGHYDLLRSTVADANHQWRAEEVVRFLSRYTPPVTLEIRMPGGFGIRRWVYRWAHDRIEVRKPDDGNATYCTGPLGGDLAPLRDGRVSLAIRQLERRSHLPDW